MIYSRQRNNIPGKYKISAKIVEGSKYIKLKNSATSVAAPSKNQEITGGITYSFRKKAKKKSLAIKLVISYDGEVLKEEIIKMKSK